jgi:hypothetical protein
MSSAPERIVQSDVHEDAVHAFGSVAARALFLLLAPLLAALLAVWWRFA